MADAEFIQKLLGGDPRTIGRAITRVENYSPDAAGLMKAVFPKTGNALIVMAWVDGRVGLPELARH